MHFLKLVPGLEGGLPNLVPHPVFIPSDGFSGHKDGYVFKLSATGLGYHVDCRGSAAPQYEHHSVQHRVPEYILRNCNVDVFGRINPTVQMDRLTGPDDVLDIYSTLHDKKGLFNQPYRARYQKDPLRWVIPQEVRADCMLHREAGIWAVDTINPNGMPGMHKYLELTSADAVLVQETKMECDRFEHMRAMVKHSGCQFVAANASVSGSNARSAGTAVVTKCFFGLTPAELSFFPEEFSSRISVAHVSSFMRGGLHFLSVYMWTNEGMSKRNLDLLQILAQVIDGLKGPWVLAADFNMNPQVIEQSGWLQLVKGRIVSTTLPTCNDNVYDFYVVCSPLAAGVRGVSRVLDAGVYPHFHVRLYLQANCRLLTKRVLRSPVLLGPRVPPGCFQKVSVPVQGDLDQIYGEAMSNIECELVSMMNFTDAQARQASGRAAGP